MQNEVNQSCYKDLTKGLDQEQDHPSRYTEQDKKFTLKIFRRNSKQQIKIK